MEKILSRLIKKIVYCKDIKEYDSNIRSSIYFISELIYINQFEYKMPFNDFLHFYSKNMKLFQKKSVILFKEYIEYQFKNKQYEEQIIAALLSLKNIINIGDISISKLYEHLSNDSQRKQLGQVYTPYEIIDNMIDISFKEMKINLYTKFLDPSCGGGYFLLKLYIRIKEYISDNKINCNECIERYIIENMLYGVDVDRFATFLSKITLTLYAHVQNLNFNIYNEDFLIEYNPKIKFDVIIGNPPYIGHKKIDSAYARLLKSTYGEVYYDKADISYCFFVAAHKILNTDGLICFITSRYFLEAKYADRLRAYINSKLNIKAIFDYNGYRVFKNAVVSPAIILLSGKRDKKHIMIGKCFNDTGKFSVFEINKNCLKNNSWSLMNEERQLVYNKIKRACNYKLSDICTIKQGIITGFDKAFIVSEEQIAAYELEKELLRKWIKNSNITTEGINYCNLYVIYSNLIDDEKNYPNTIAYLLNYKSRLSNRRECKSGIRKWYELQWGRDLKIFESNKIVFPYKAKNNNFYYDRNKYLCSADIYTLAIKDELTTYEYLVKYLNSDVFEFYFKCNAKKVGEKLFEYYPNILKNLDIYIPEDKNDKILTIDDEIYVENHLKKLFNITVEDNNIIKNSIQI